MAGITRNTLCRLLLAASILALPAAAADGARIECPPGAYLEAEPCGTNTNPGCGVEPPALETIADGGVVCGTAWADGGQRDEDWYEVWLTGGAKRIRLQNIDVELPLRVRLYSRPPITCEDLPDSVSVLCQPGVPGTLELVASPQWNSYLVCGRYWIRVAPEDQTGPILHGYPCGTSNDYQFEVVVDYEPYPLCWLPWWFSWENEPDYCTSPQPDTFNAGCDQFLTPPGPSYYISDSFEILCATSGWYNLPAVICPGDLNCDGVLDFGDINPFVSALANWPVWLAQHPNCPPKNADINGDGAYGGPRGFGDINPFVRLLAGGAGQPIPCSHDPVPTPDYDWFRFRIVDGPKTTSLFFVSGFQATLEVYSQAEGCYVPPMARWEIASYDTLSVKFPCLAPGWYWMRVIPKPGVPCGRQYEIGIEEFLACEPCDLACQPSDTRENEACGQHVNDACGPAAMPIPDPYWPNQSVICGTTYNLLQPEETDEDWYRFDIPPGENRYLVVVLNAEIALTPWVTIQGCEGLGWLVEDGIDCDPGGQWRGFYIDKAHIPGGAHVDLRITPQLWNRYAGWHANPVHAPCETTYRLIAGYSPTPPRDGDFGIQFEELTPSAPPPR